MDNSEIVVVVSAGALTAVVLWYFFGPKRAAAATVGSGAQQIKVLVKGGYSPDVIAVRTGLPVRLDFYRDETATCSEQVVLPDFGIARDLPAFQTTTIEFTPTSPGEYTFACGMSMMRGKLIVEARPGGEPAASSGAAHA